MDSNDEKKGTQEETILAGLKFENQIKEFFSHCFLMNIMLFCSCKGWNKEREYHRRSSEFNRPRRACVCKTNKPLQNRTSYSETDHRVLTKTLLYQNDGSFSKDMIFHTRQAGRQAADPTNIHPESKVSGVSAACVPICGWIQAFFPPPFALLMSHQEIFYLGRCCFFPKIYLCNRGQVHTSSLERVNGRTVPVVAGGLQVVAQSIEWCLQLAWSQPSGGMALHF